jgi:hypothetical protein
VGELLELTVKEAGGRRDLLLKEESDSSGINSEGVKWGEWSGRVNSEGIWREEESTTEGGE